jgi:hypothetical protein
MPSRFIFHPILENKRSRLILLGYLLIAGAVAYGFYLQVNHTLQVAGLSRMSTLLWEDMRFKVILSPRFMVGITFATALFASTLTSRFVIGPIKRIERWLQDWADGLNPFPLLVRRGDKFVYFVSLLNTLYQKLTRPPQAQ